MLKLIVITAALLASTSAFAQTNYYGSNGGYQGRSQPDGVGGQLYYGPNGGYQGRAQPDGTGGTLYYGNNGGYRGRAQNTNPPGYQLNGSRTHCTVPGVGLGC